MNRIMILAALVAAPLIASPSQAQGAEADRTRVVSVADLDLSRKADVRMLDIRIRRAVEEVCGTASDADPHGKNEVRRCRALTAERVALQRDQAVASADRPAAIALVAER